MKNIIKKLKSVNGQSLAEFAVTTAMMATLATTAAPKFSGVGEGAKEKKTLSDIDKILKAANNFYNTEVTEAGNGGVEILSNKKSFISDSKLLVNGKRPNSLNINLNVGLTSLNMFGSPRFLAISLNLSCISSEG